MFVQMAMSGKLDNDKSQKDELLKQTANEYSDYFQIDTSAERAGLDRELESMLTRLEEYGSLLERTRSVSRHTVDDQVPQIYSHYQALQTTFKSIDSLEVLVKRVKEDLIKMEAAVSKAETDLNPSHGFAIRPLFFRKEQTIPQSHTTVQGNFVPPDIFHADDYFISDAESQTSRQKPASGI